MIRWLSSLWSTLRGLGSARMFALGVVATIALGAGANAAVFSVLHAIVLRALPYPEAERIVALSQRASPDDADAINIGYATLDDVRTQAASFDRIAAYGSWMPAMETSSGAEQVPGVRVTHGFFSTLGVVPALGRDFAAADDTWDARNNGVILDHGLWQSRYASDPGVIGRTIRLSGREVVVIGVLPADFRPVGFADGGRPPLVWAPLGYDLQRDFACRSCQHLLAIARLKPGVALAGARSELATLAAHLASAFPDDYAATMTLAIDPLAQRVVGGVQRSLWLLLGAVCLVLLIAASNVSSLFAARALARSRDLAVRSALGANRARLVGTLLNEAVLLGIAGGVAGLALAHALLPALRALAPEALPRLDEVAVDASVFGYGLCLALACSMLAAIWPAWRAADVAPALAIKVGGHGAIGGRMRLQRLLVAAQVTIAVVVLSCGALMLRSLSEVSASDPGFDPRGVGVADLVLTGPAYAEPGTAGRFHDALRRQLATSPAIDHAAIVTPLPLGGDYDRAGFHRRDVPIPGTEAPDVDRIVASTGYFDTLGVPLLRGRAFDATDRADTAPVAVVNRTLAERWFSGRDPIGREIQLGGLNADSPWVTVVGVVGDVRQYGLDQPATAQVYLPATQSEPSVFSVVVRGEHPASALDALRAAVRAIDPGVPVSAAGPLEQRISGTLAARRFTVALIAAFGVLGLALALVGVHGTLANTVARRQQEIGLRAALGATGPRLARWMLAGALSPVGAGAVAGLAACVPATLAIRDQLYGVSLVDPAAFGAALILVAAGSLIACLVPLKRALAVGPLETLRQE